MNVVFNCKWPNEDLTQIECDLSLEDKSNIRVGDLIFLEGEHFIVVEKGFFTISIIPWEVGSSCPTNMFWLMNQM